MNNRYVNLGIFNFNNKKINMFYDKQEKTRKFFIVQNNFLININEEEAKTLNELFNTPKDYFAIDYRKAIATFLIFTSLVTASTLNVRAANTEKQELSYTDINPDSEDSLVINYLAENNIMVGYSDTFSPNENVTRAMASQIIFNMAKEFSNSTTSFNDVSPNDWYYNAVSFCEKEHIINGVSSHEFKPNEKINYEQLSVMLYRLLTNHYQIKPVVKITEPSSYYANESLIWAKQMKIIPEMDNYKENISRIECARMIYKFAKVYGNILYETNNNQGFDEAVNEMNAPEEIKTLFHKYEQIFQDYDLSPERYNDIVNTFATMKINDNFKTDSQNFTNNITGVYLYKDNNLNINVKSGNDNYNITMFHEGVHALTNNYNKSKTVGLADINNNLGVGITEAMTDIVTSEYLGKDPDSYRLSQAATKALLEIIDDSKAITMFLNGDSTGFINYLNSLDNNFGYEIIGRLDTLYLMDTCRLDIDTNYLSETFDIIKNVANKLDENKNTYLISQLENIALWESEHEYQDLTEYKLNKYYFNKAFFNEKPTIETISNEDILASKDDNLIEAAKNLNKRELASYIKINYPSLIKTTSPYTQQLNK